MAAISFDSEGRREWWDAEMGVWIRMNRIRGGVCNCDCMQALNPDTKRWSARFFTKASLHRWPRKD